MHMQWPYKPHPPQSKHAGLLVWVIQVPPGLYNMLFMVFSPR